MKRLVLVPTMIGVAAAGAVGVLGPASASASRARTESFTIISVSDPSTSTVIARGVFTAGGTDDSGRSVDHLTFADGTLTLDHHGQGRTTSDPTTCLVTTTGSGTFRVAAGTGAYQRVRGSGHYTFDARVVLARTSSGACDGNAEPTAFEYVVRARGRLTN